MGPRRRVESRRRLKRRQSSRYSQLRVEQEHVWMNIFSEAPSFFFDNETRFQKGAGIEES